MSLIDRICLGTTSYVTEDKNSDLEFLAKTICPDVPILSVDPGLEKSTKNGLIMYDKGVVKEGVGSGGALNHIAIEIKWIP